VKPGLAELRREWRLHPLDPPSLEPVVVSPDFVAMRPESQTDGNVVFRLFDREFDTRKAGHDMLGPVDHPIELPALSQPVRECQGLACDRHGNGHRSGQTVLDGVEPYDAPPVIFTPITHRAEDWREQPRGSNLVAPGCGDAMIRSRIYSPLARSSWTSTADLCNCRDNSAKLAKSRENLIKVVKRLRPQDRTKYMPENNLQLARPPYLQPGALRNSKCSHRVLPGKPDPQGAHWSDLDPGVWSEFKPRV
jgi:hypothetical protein